MTAEAGCTVAQSSVATEIFSGGLLPPGCTHQAQASVGTSALGADRSHGVSGWRGSACRMQERMSDKQRPAGHQGVTKWGLKNTRANELGKGMAGGGMNYHTQDKTEAFLPEKGRLMSHVQDCSRKCGRYRSCAPVLRTNIPHLQHAISSRLQGKTGRTQEQQWALNLRHPQAPASRAAVWRLS